MPQKFNAQFSVLSKPQQLRFRLFLQSPYFNTNAKMLQLHDCLCNGVSQKEAIHLELFPTAAYDDLRLRRMLSDFSKLTDQFLTAEDTLHNKVQIAEATLNTYLRSGEPKLFTQQLQSVNKQLDQSTNRDCQYHYHQFKLSEWAYTFASKTQNRTTSTDLQETLRQLDLFHATTKLKYTCELVNRANVLNEPYNKTDIAQALGYYGTFGNVPAIVVYHHILLTLTEPDELAHYQVLKKLLTENAVYFKATEVRDLYGFAQNYCIKKINGGNTGFLEELFHLYEQLLSNGAILDNGELSAPDYKNIVFVGLRLSKYEWIRGFMEQYHDLLPAANGRDAYIYNLAYYHYFRKEYQETLQLLNTVRFKDVYYYLDSRSLLLKTFYELDEIDPLYSLMESSSAYLRRNKLISPYQKQIYQNLFRYVKKLVSYQSKPKAERAKLLARLEQETAIADKVWLRSKLQETV